MKKNEGEYFVRMHQVELLKHLLMFFSDLFYSHGWTLFSYINRTINSEKELANYLSIINDIKKI